MRGVLSTTAKSTKRFPWAVGPTSRKTVPLKASAGCWATSDGVASRAPAATTSSARRIQVGRALRGSRERIKGLLVRERLYDTRSEWLAKAGVVAGPAGTATRAGGRTRQSGQPARRTGT